MSDWFYTDGTTRHGPVSPDALRAALVALPDPRRVLVWRDGMATWAPVDSIAELAGVTAGLPPPVPTDTSSGVRTSPVGASSATQDSPDTDARSIEAGALLYRQLVCLVGVQLIYGVAAMVLSPGVVGETLAVLAGIPMALVGLALMVAIAVTAYRLSRHIDKGVPALWAVLMFVPCLNLLGLLILSQAAQIWCARYGIQVGLLGPTRASLAWLREEGRR